MLLAFSHNRNMPKRRGIPKEVNWYLQDWMNHTERFSKRGGQARMMEETGWSKATMSQLYNYVQDFSPTILKEAARALNAQMWELLMPYESAMAIRRLRADALRIVEDVPPPTILIPNQTPRRVAGKKKATRR